MSRVVMDWAVQCRTENPLQKLILMLLADHHNATTGRCDPSYRRLADRACCSVRTVQRCIRALEQQGLIAVCRRPHQTCQFEILVPEAGSRRETRPAESPRRPRSENPSVGARESGQGVPESPSSGDSVSPEPGSNNSVRKPGSDQPSFEVFVEDGEPHGDLDSFVDSVISAWNDRMFDQGEIRIPTTELRRRIETARQDYPKSSELGWWPRLFEFCRESDFLMGRAPARGERAPFRLRLEWLADLENLAKVLNGNFHD
ncbi:MAG: helix-turn-helix domain-containing protein [Pseudomonadales bacterium]|jgi:hypothetical protein|nr:helix-turn-helix domain-containing protein [Pseudomonadales bacterium]